MSRDVVYLRRLHVDAHIGVTEAERSKPQALLLDIEMAWDASVPAADDDIAKAVNYHEVSNAVVAYCGEHVHKLVETLAERLATLIRTEFNVPWIRIAVGKPDILAHVAEVGVVIERGTRAKQDSSS